MASAFSPSIAIGIAFVRSPPSWKPSCSSQGDSGSGRLLAACGLVGGRGGEQMRDAECGGCVVARLRHRAEQRQIAVDKAGIDGAAPEFVGTAQVAQERDIAAHARNERALKRAKEPVERGLPRRPLRDELGNHRVVKRRDLPAGFDAGVDADIARQFQRHDRTGRWQEVMLRILGIDARFDGMAVDADFILGKRQLFAGCNAELPFDEIEAGDRLGDRMLDLEPGIHFNEPDGVGPQLFAAVGDEFDGAGAAVINRFAAATAAAPIRARNCALMPGAGASSITF